MREVTVFTVDRVEHTESEGGTETLTEGESRVYSLEINLIDRGWLTAVHYFQRI